MNNVAQIRVTGGPRGGSVSTPHSQKTVDIPDGSLSL